jgi:hypothetical protein
MQRSEHKWCRPPSSARSAFTARPQAMQWACSGLEVGAVSRAIRSCFKVSSIELMINCLDSRRSGDEIRAGLSWRRWRCRGERDLVFDVLLFSLFDGSRV